MWRAQAGFKTQQPQEEEEDDWETDPDFVVRAGQNAVLIQGVEG